ncbi:MAG TPA: UvrB/UvrC motif-containing protein [Candidatus Paceibacterota bacterium]
MKFKYISKEKVGEIPKAPGVYSFWDEKSLLYIGKAASLRDRVKNHFQQPSYRDDLFIDRVEKIGYIETESEIEALLLESQLIKQNLPKYNVMWKDGKGYFSVLITKEEYPRVLLIHQKDEEGTYIGPFVDGKAIKRTLRSLRKVFPYYTAKKHGLKLCQYCHLELCPGPRPDKKEYQKSIKNLTAVLRAQKPAVLKKLQREMTLASKNQAYEIASRLRDQIQDLEIIFSHARVLRPGTEKTPLNWPGTEKYLQKVLQTTQRISRVEAYDISNIQGKEATGSMPVFIDGKPAKQHYRKFKIHIAGTPNDFAMLKEVIGRRLTHPEWPYPDLMIIDGGKPQLSATLKAIEETTKQTMHNFHDREKSVRKIRSIRVAAIAKKHNELFLPGQPKPLLLKDMPQQVSNFILHMRDEAHRFAITYHRKLRRVDLLGKRK